MSSPTETISKHTNSWYKDLSADAHANKYIIDEYFDVEYTRSLIEHVIDFLDRYYFRSKLVGFEHLPERNNPDTPLIFASNHSGMAFPWDGIIMASRLYEMFDYGPKSPRPLASPMLSDSVLMNPYLYENLWKIVGSVDASFLNFETLMLQREHNLLIYPEGVPGIAKGFDKRYQLQRFSSSFITMSLKYQTDIVPILTVNAEYINPYAYRSGLLNKLVNKIGVPFFPVGPISLLLPLQPWIFYMGFPAQLTYVLGDVISPYKMTNKKLEDLPYDELVEIKENVKANMQGQLNAAVAKYGSKPYQLKSFFQINFKNINKLPFSMPFGWPLLFALFNRWWRKNKHQGKPFKIKFLSVFKILLQSPRQIFFYIPILGWIPIFIKGIKRR